MADSPETNTAGPVGITIKLDGTALTDDTLVQSVRVRNEVNRIPEATFVLLSDALQVEDFTPIDSPDYALGTEVEIAGFYGSGDETTLFKGVVVSQRASIDGRRGMRMELTCRDKAIALSEVRNTVPYMDMKDSDVMSAVISDAGLTADVTSTSSTFPSQLRIGATDWDFLRLLADRNGFLLSVDDAKITAAAPDDSTAAVLTVTVGIDVIELDITIDSQRMIGTASASAWSEQSQEAVQGEGGSVPTLLFGDTVESDVAEVLGTRAQDAFTAREFETADLSSMAEARVLRATLATLRGAVKFQGYGAIKPTEVLEIKGMGNRFSGNGFVTGVEHTIENGSWTTQTYLGLPQDWTSDLPDLAGPAAEALTTPIHGLQIGKVMTVAEDPDGKQRIQVTLPMIGDPPAEVWARYATPYATANAGFQFLPEVDDEVVVAFLNADPNAPVIVGSLHNATATRPVAETADNYIKTITTPTALKMTFDDEKMIITVETPGGHVLTMDDDATTFSMVDSNGNSIVMDDSGITMTTDFDITMTATGDITAEATGDATVNGSNVTCEGQIGFTGKGGGTAELSSGGQTKVEGTMVNIN